MKNRKNKSIFITFSVINSINVTMKMIYRAANDELKSLI